MEPNCSPKRRTLSQKERKAPTPGTAYAVIDKMLKTALGSLSQDAVLIPYKALTFKGT